MTLFPGYFEIWDVAMIKCGVMFFKHARPMQTHRPNCNCAPCNASSAARRLRPPACVGRLGILAIDGGDDDDRWVGSGEESLINTI